MDVYRKGIFCLESEWFGLASSVSVRLALEMLRASDYRIQFIRKDVATGGELVHYLRKWLQGKHNGFEILWLSMHSRRGLLLPGDMRRKGGTLNMDELEAALAGKCAGRLIHFGGCRTIALPAARIERFLKATRAVAISGFNEEVDWTESTLFEMAYLLELQKHPLNAKGMRAVRAAMRRHRPLEYKASGFSVHVRK